MRKRFLSATFLVLVALLFAQSTAQSSQPNPQILWERERLSVEVSGTSLLDVLEEIQRQTDLRILRTGTVERSLSVTLYEMPLEQALRKVLEHTNYAIIESPGRTGSPAFTVTLFGSTRQPSLDAPSPPSNSAIAFHKLGASGPNQAKRIAELRERAFHQDFAGLGKAAKSGDPAVQTVALALLATHDSDAAGNLAESALHSSDVRSRIAGIQTLADLGRPIPSRELKAALTDSDVGVRQSALTALMGQTGDEIIPLLTEATRDSDPSIQMTAMDLLAERGPEGEAALRETLHMSDPQVQKHAEELLKQIAAAR